MTTFVITGTRVGIGLEHVRQASQNPNNTVFALVRSLTSGDLTALKEIQSSAGPERVHIIECDTSSETSIASLPGRLTTQSSSSSPLRIDVLINNAAILHNDDQNALNLTGDAFLSHMTTNVLGPARTTQALLPLLAPDAKIVNVTSGLGSLKLLTEGRIPAAVAPYSISKAALNMLTVHQAKQLPEGIVAVAIDPGHVKTEMGGPNAVLEIPDSVRGIQSVVAGLRREDSGRFMDYTGTDVPW
jgi:NAD(P)-dependent dehydrogenase (short-subunit alcohol dehydrogenase family)